MEESASASPAWQRRPSPELDTPGLGARVRSAAAVAAVGVVLVLAALFWNEVAKLGGAVGDARSAFRPDVTALDRPITSRPAVGLAPPTDAGASSSPDPAMPSPTPTPSPSPTPTSSPTPVPNATPTPPASASPTPSAEDRQPWVLLPLPGPGSHVAAGPVVMEARGRGTAPIVEIRLELDGVPLAVTMDQRSESIWRGQAQVTVAPGRHSARAVVVDQRGRTGAYRWEFTAGP